MKQRIARPVIKGRMLALVVTAVSFCYLASYCDDARLASDPVDYIEAATRGFLPMYFDTGGITPWALYSAIRNEHDPHAWEYLERRGDPASGRHFHVAFSFYPYALATDLGLGDRALRLLTAAEGSVAIGITFSGLLMAGVGVTLALAAACLTLLSPSIVATFTSPSPHTLFLGLMLAFGFALAECLRSQTEGGFYRRAAIILFALLVATLELSIVVAAAAVAVLALRALRGDRYRAVEVRGGVLLAIAALILAWPGGVIRGGYLLSYGAFLFQATVRRGSYYGSASLGATLMAGNEMSAAVSAIGLIAALATVVLLAWRRSTPYLDVFAWLTLGFGLQGYLNRFHNTTYVAHFSALRWILLALCGQQWIDVTGSRWAKTCVVAALFIAGIGALAWPAENRRTFVNRDVFSERAGEAMDYMRVRMAPGAVIVTNTERGIWRHYMPGHPIEAAEPGSMKPSPLARVRDYWAITDPAILKSEWRQGVVVEPGAIVGGFGIYKCHLMP